LIDYDSLVNKIKKNNIIDPVDFDEFEVKRGLRNKDGSGVLVGLTKIGHVHGYIKDEYEVVPVDGELYYRGINIFDITRNIEKEKRKGFEEVAYLLLFGELPNKTELDEFCRLLSKHRVLPTGFTENMILKSPSNNIMNKLARSVLAFYSYDKNPEDLSIKNIIRQCIILIASFPTLIAYGYQAKNHYFNNKSLFIHNPKEKLSTAENFLNLIRQDGKYTKLEADMLDTMLIIHAEHSGGNNSAFTTHVVSSTDTDTYSVIAAAVGSLKGPKHGGANIKVMDMIANIKKNVKNWSNERELKEYLIKILRKKAFDRTGLIYGIGHAVYTLSDPRLRILKQKAVKLAKERNRIEEYNLYALIEKLGPEVFYELKGKKKDLCANVDFYSGFVYEMLDIPKELYTPLFAMSRIAGWSAHRIEEIISNKRIIRPAYKNVSERCKYVPLKQRRNRFRH
jgi:citrate synthase